MRIQIEKKEVLEAIEKDSPATLPEIVNSLGKKNQMFISGYLRALEHLGIIKSKDVGTSVVFVIQEKRVRK